MLRGGVDLDRDDELAGLEQLGQAGRGWSVAGGGRGGRAFRERGRGSGEVDFDGGGGGWRLGRPDHVERDPHRGDVLGCGPATAADDPCPGCQQTRRDRPEVLGAGGVDEAPLEPLRKSGVGHDRPHGLAIRGSAHRLERIETGRGPGPAVHSDRVRACPGKRVGGRGRAVAVGEHEFLAECQRCDDRDVRGAPGFVDGKEQLLQIRECLEDDQVRAALEQALDLLAEGGPRGRLGDDRPAPRRRPEGPDRTTNERVASADFACLPGELSRAPVDPAHLTLESPGRETLPVGAERQRLDQLRARLEILPMGRPDHLWMASDKLLETGALRHAATEQQRPQAAVHQERSGGDAASEALPRRANGRGLGHRSPIERPGSGGGTGYDKTLPARKGLEGSSLIVQEDLPGLGTLSARGR